MADRFAIFDVHLDSPAQSGEAITPSDTVNMNVATRAIYVGVAGNVSVQMVGYEGQANVNVLLQNVPVGLLPIRAERVHAANTTAGGLVGLY